MKQQSNVSPETYECHDCGLVLPICDVRPPMPCPNCDSGTMQPSAWKHLATMLDDENQVDLDFNGTHIRIVRSFDDQSIHILLGEQPASGK